MKDKQLIIGNWKMNPKSAREARATFLNIKSKAAKLRNVQTIICPTHVHIRELTQSVTGHRCVLGAQDVSAEKEGAHTGDVSAAQLLDSGVTHCIVGHSERRATGESDSLISKKIQLLTKNNITPILCIGEQQRDEAGRYIQHIKQQLLGSLQGVPKTQIGGLVIAYEPIWAIGKDAQREATPEDILEISILIRKILVDAYGKKTGESVTIIYGGSVHPENAESILVRGGVEGLLVGRASLDPTKFTTLISLANSI